MYTTENGLVFSLLPETDETRAFADRLAAVLDARRPDVADFLLEDEGFCALFPDADKAQIISGLGLPIFTLLGAAGGVITFPGVSLGEEKRLLSFEFSGELEGFFDLDLDN